jgi:uncharacterized phiE125 gp8 family phage protein
VPSADYTVYGVSDAPRIVRRAPSWPPPGLAAHGIEINLTAGFGATAAAVPAPIRQALLMLVAHWYEHRDPIEIGAEATVIPTGVSELMQPWRRARL